ncbi:MAG: peroxide stress protein YaaA [Aquabacterium sp.]|uniref:peroxide stress protein YaaA n=1 Tax=Aquabacterium sp. TaxID=1872578 RepID=UPI00122B7BFC|nr:peroxide stress protein YaaA [Aquabacterium sp.]TAK93933.1 MAG: peroxide stress protein YaaA [Aquabacterium sp.]
MLILLSPAKSLDYDTAPTTDKHTLPQFVSDSAGLIEVLKPYTPAQIASLMDLSDALSTLNVARYAAWRPRFTAKNSKQAILAFNGDVYEGLNAASLDQADLDWAQSHVGILSGLYGVLRPLDWMQPYRLEMGTKLQNPRGKDLYAWWGDTLANHLDAQLKKQGDDVIINLASQEYFKSVKRKALKARVVECVFEDWKGAGWKIISFHAKRARGLMARHAILKRARKPADLLDFDAEGYAYDATVSSPDRLVFRRTSPA